jgi:uncharacterized protein (DUF433 family)
VPRFAFLSVIFRLSFLSPLPIRIWLVIHDDTVYDMSKRASDPFSMRIGRSIHQRLERRALRGNHSKSALAERFIDEGLRQDAHPEIVFRDGPFGRRPLLAGTRLEVGQVVETIRNSGNSVDDAAAYLDLPSSRVRAALSYYAAFQHEVDEQARRAVAAAEDAERAWRREQELIGG